MFHVLHYIFWICAGIIFYNYIGYGIILMMLTGTKRLFANRKHADQSAAGLPGVTLVVAAYNEEAVIEEKIKNCLSLNYPEDRLHFLFITDGSTDSTMKVIHRYPRICLLHEPERKGKSAALNRAMQYVSTPVTVFCDANTMLNRSAIRRIVRHYRSSRTGGVSGEKKIQVQKDNTAMGSGEGLYWKYESFLKRLDASLYTVTGAAGELFSIRTTLWSPVPENVILDDFVISTRINLRGYRIAYEPFAYASELPSASLAEEKKRKVRISSGAFQSMVMLKEVFNIFKHPVLFFQFFSHRFLRWTLTPLSFPVLFVTNMFLALPGGIFYKITLLSQILFYLLAWIGYHSRSGSRKVKALKIFHYIFFMNYSVYLGFFRFLKGNQSGVWEKAERKVFVRAE